MRFTRLLTAGLSMAALTLVGAIPLVASPNDAAKDPPETLELPRASLADLDYVGVRSAHEVSDYWVDYNWHVDSSRRDMIVTARLHHHTSSMAESDYPETVSNIRRTNAGLSMDRPATDQRDAVQASIPNARLEAANDNEDFRPTNLNGFGYSEAMAYRRVDSLPAMREMLGRGRRFEVGDQINVRSDDVPTEVWQQSICQVQTLIDRPVARVESWHTHTLKLSLVGSREVDGVTCLVFAYKVARWMPVVETEIQNARPGGVTREHTHDELYFGTGALAFDAETGLLRLNAEADRFCPPRISANTADNLSDSAVRGEDVVNSSRAADLLADFSGTEADDIATRALTKQGAWTRFSYEAPNSQ